MVRTTVVGTYPRIGDTFGEQSLRRAIARFDKGEIDESQLRASEREVTTAVLREQDAAGIDVVTDGQIGWYDSQSHIARKLRSVEITGLARYFDTNTYYRQPFVRGPVAWDGPILVDEWAFAQSVSRAPVKAVLTGPFTLASLAVDQHYRDRRKLTAELAAALAEETAALVNAGARHIQVDEPALTLHPKEVRLALQGLEEIAARKGPAILTLFIYFGDVTGIFSDLEAAPTDFLGLDLVQGAKTWEVLVKSGSAKSLVLGVLDARNTKREDPRDVAKRILALEGKVDLGSSYLSPSNGLEFLPRDKAREKLRVLVEAAKLVEVGS
jgi:5-methyltetrahydropteroyltriglutamate--homocysteine methyltransferase